VSLSISIGDPDEFELSACRFAWEVSRGWDFGSGEGASCCAFKRPRQHSNISKWSARAHVCPTERGVFIGQQTSTRRPLRSGDADSITDHSRLPRVFLFLHESSPPETRLRPVAANRQRHGAQSGTMNTRTHSCPEPLPCSPSFCNSSIFVHGVSGRCSATVRSGCRPSRRAACHTSDA
jgi:hypothetical protein